MDLSSYSSLAVTVLMYGHSPGVLLWVDVTAVIMSKYDVFSTEVNKHIAVLFLSYSTQLKFSAEQAHLFSVMIPN